MPFSQRAPVLLVSSLLCSFLIGTHATQVEAGNRVAVVPFGAVLGQAGVGSQSRALTGSQTLDPLATQELVAALSAIEHLILIDQAVVTEKMGILASSAKSDEDRRKRLGELLSADWIVTGDLSYTSEKGKEEDLDVTSSGNLRTVRVPTVTINATMSAQITEVKTSRSFAHVSTQTKSLRGRGGETSKQSQEAAVAEALKSAAADLALDLASHIELVGTILSVETTTEKKSKTILVVSLCEVDGVKKGAKLKISRGGGKVMDPATGVEKSLPERSVGECSITEVGTETSYAELKDGQAAVGDRVTLALSGRRGKGLVGSLLGR